MYIPKEYESTDFSKQVALIREYPLGVLFSSETRKSGILQFASQLYETKSPEVEMEASHIPFLFVESKDGKHKLIAHLARRNQLIDLLERSGKCLVVFQSVDSYISPSWYPLKKETHKFVPTWDFAAVHVYGTPKIIRDDKDWLINMLTLLTAQEEGKRPKGAEYEEKWKVSDAPESYLAIMLKNIVGIEIEIDSIQSKFKFDQKSPVVNVQGVIKNLLHEVGGDKGKGMAALVKENYPTEFLPDS